MLFFFTFHSLKNPEKKYYRFQKNIKQQTVANIDQKISILEWLLKTGVIKLIFFIQF